MWKDLTLKEKAEIMKMSVANGVTDINDIQQLYDDSVGHRFDDAGRIITLADLPREYVQRYGHINVVTPKGVRMPLSQAYRDYNQTTINVNDVPGLTNYLIKQDNPDIQEQAHLDKLAADREIRQRNNIINGPIFDKKKIYNRVPGDMWQAVVSDKDGQNIGANRGIVRSLFGYYFNPDNAVESRLQRYEKYKDLSMEEVMNAGIEFDRMWEKYGLDSIRNNPILSRKMTELESKMRAPHVLQHEDAKDLYLGLPQRNNTMKDAEYSPTNGKLRNGKYISYMRDPAFVNDVIMKSYNDLKYGFIDEETTHPGLYKDHVYNKRLTPVKEITPRGYARVEFPFLNNATLSGGIDPQRGEYASIFDTWDYNTNIMGTPGDNVGEYIGGEPFDIYDRYYLDDYYGINSKPQDDGYYGGYLPELSVVNKKALGGHLYKNAGPLDKAKDQPKYQYGIIEQILRENGVNFRVTSGARKPNQAGNAGKGSAHTYTIFGNSPGAIDIVPGVGSDWNTLFAQMNSPKVRRALAAYGLDVLNETNPSVMASTHATGPHLHVGRGIKGQSGTGQMFGGTSFGDGKGSYAMPQYSTAGSDNYASMMQQQAMEPITLAGSNAASPWLDYISKIGQQRPVSFNTPIGTPSDLASNGQINIGPVDFSSIGKADELMSFIDPYTSKQALEYNLGLDNNALWNSPYLLFNEHNAANGGHLYDTAGQMLIRSNAVNPALQYVYGPEYEDIIRQRRNWRPNSRINVQRSKPKYDIEARGDATTNTVRPTQRVIRRKQTSESPARRAKEQQRYDAMMTQYRNERQGTISQAPDRVRHPDYDPVRANQVQQRYEQNEIAEQKAHNRRVLEHNMLEGMEAIPWPSTVAGAWFNPNTHWYDPFSFFSNLYAKDNRGFFNYNQATRNFYDANPEVGSIANLVGDFVVPGAAAKALKGVSRLSKFAAADIGNSWKTMRYELAHPEAQTLGIIPDRLNPFISERKYYDKVQKLNELEHPLMYKQYRVGAGNYSGRLTSASGKPTSDITGVDNIMYNTPIMNFPGGDPKDILKWHEEIPLQNGLVLDFDPATLYDNSPFLPLDNKYNIISNVGNDQELVVKNILGTTTERFNRNPVTMSGNQSGLIPMNTEFSYPSFRDISIKVNPKTGETNIGSTPPIGFSAKQTGWYPVYPEITGGQPVILPETHPIRRAATQYVTDLERRLATDSGIPLATVEGSYRAVMNGLPHTPKDVEFLLPESNLKKLEKLFNVRTMKPKGNGFGYTVEAEEFDHLFGNVNGKVADFEVLKNGPNGGAIGNTAWEIYQYLHPEEASKLAEKYMNSVASDVRSMAAESYKEGMELPISAEQLYKEYVESGLYKDKYLYDTMVAMPDNDPTKHMFRRNDLELGSDPNVMLPKLTDRIHREIPGAKTLKEQGFNIDYTNVEANKKFLDYWGLPQEFATDPKRMEIVVEQQIHAYQMAKRGTNIAIPGQSGESWVRKPLSERKEDIRTMNTEAGGGSGFGPGENATNQINRVNDRTGLTREVEVARQIPLTVDPAKIKSIKTPEDLINRIEEIKDLSIKHGNELQRLNSLATKQETHDFAMQHDIPAYSLGTEYPGGVGNYHANLLMNKDIAFDMRYVGDKKGFEFLKPFQFRTFDKSFAPWKATQEYTDEVLTKLWDAAKGHKERELDAHQFQRLEDIRKQLKRKHNLTKNVIRTSKLAAGAATVAGLSKFVYDEVKRKPTNDECELNIRTANALVDMLKNNNTDTATLDQYIYFYTGEKLTGKSAKEAEKIKKEALDNAKEDLKYNQDVLKEREERHKRWEERQKKRRKRELKNTLKTSRKEGYEE